MIHRSPYKQIVILVILWCVLPFTITIAGNPPFRQWVPIVFGPSPEPQYLINVPYFPVASVTDERFEQMAIFWFGQLSRDTNYTDVRIGYNDTALYLYLASFDRQLWYDTTPSPADLTAWDAATLFIDTANGTRLSAASFRFIAQFRGDPVPDPNYQLSQRATGGSWSTTAVAFSSIPGWRGDRLNDNNDSEDRGWAMTFQIPFTSLGLSGRPSDGTRWRIALIVHDRDNAAGNPAIPDQSWPPALRADVPSTWGGIRFGLPTYTPPATGSVQEFQIRHRLNGVTVVDVGIGGVNPYMCDDSGDYWNTWGNRPRPSDQGDVSIQNQSDIADWPCFAKYYITFPLSTLPAGRTVISASLILSQMGNAEPSQAQRSLIQAFLVGEDWNPATLTWNNAPLVRENVGSGWVDPIPQFPGWENLPKREIDVTWGFVQAYTRGQPLRLALYSADSAYHSGKYFVSSNTGDWNAENRPTLVVRLSP